MSPDRDQPAAVSAPYPRRGFHGIFVSKSQPAIGTLAWPSVNDRPSRLFSAQQEALQRSLGVELWKTTRVASKAAGTDSVWGLIRESALGTSQFQEISICLIALSIADIIMTFTLLRTSHSYYESNPVVGWFFARWNMTGMVVLKFAAIALAIALGEMIERRRPGLGQLVLLVGCAAAATVVWHSLRLYLGAPGLPVGGGE